MSVNLIIGVLLAKGIVEKEEAEYLVKELESGITPSNFTLAARQIQTVFDNWGKKQEKKSTKKPIAKGETV